MKRKPRQYEQFHISGRFVVDGALYETSTQVFRTAQTKGFNGTYKCISGRLSRGASTWVELLSPRNPVMGAVTDARLRKIAKDREEMAALCAEMDARKAGKVLP